MTRFAAAFSALAVCASLASGVIVSGDCGDTPISNTAGACIKDHEFKTGSPFDFVKTKVKNTKFTGVTFKGGNKFDQTEWDGVEFNSCTFAESVKINKGNAASVTFNKCTIDAGAVLALEGMGMKDIKFIDCVFNGDLMMKKVTTTGLSFKGGQMSPETSIIFNLATTTGLTLTDMPVKGSLRFLGSTTTNFKTTGSTAFTKPLFCNQASGEKFSSQSTFKKTEFVGTQFLEFQCQESTWDDMTLTDITVTNDMLFNGAKLSNVKWNGIGAKMIDVSYGTISNGDIITNLKESNVSFHGVKFANPIDMFTLDLADTKKFNLKHAEFSQTCIGKTSCTKFCGKRDDKKGLCQCAADDDKTDCTKEGSNVDATLNPETNAAKKEEKKKSCFPADSMVQMASGAVVKMAQLEHSDNVAIGGGKHSEVFFFGHKHATQMADFVHISASGSTKELRISPGHYLYVNGRLSTARTVLVGDELETGDGKKAKVTSVRIAEAQGMFAPTTMHGNIVVDGIVVSSYTDALHPRMAHNFLAPLRALHASGLSQVSSRFTALHSRSAASVASMFGLAGPATVETI